MEFVPSDTTNPGVKVGSRLVVLVTAEQLPRQALGCYGHPWVDTSTLDRLAAEGFVFDTCISEAVSEPGLDLSIPEGCRLTPLLSITAGRRCLFLREDAAVAVSDPRFAIADPDSGHSDITSSSDLPFARLVQLAKTRLLADDGQSELIWLHSAGTPLDVLPPEETWDLYADEFSEEDLDWSARDDAEWLQHPAIRAVSVSLWDFWLAELVSCLKSLPRRILLLVVTLQGQNWLAVERARQLPDELTASRVHVPWILWESPLPSGASAWEPGRTSAIVQPIDLVPTIKEWWEHKTDVEPVDAISGIDETRAARSVWPLIRGETRHHRAWAATRAASGISYWTPSQQWIVQSEINRASPEDVISAYQQPEDPWNIFDVALTIPGGFSRVQQDVLELGAFREE